MWDNSVRKLNVTGWRYWFRILAEIVNFIFTHASRQALVTHTASNSMKIRCYQR
jgi:hypothetical protein